jgi:hypothetical protein
MGPNILSFLNEKILRVLSLRYCDALPEIRNIGGCISDCFLDNVVPNTGNRKIAAVPIQRKRQHTSATELSDKVLCIQSAKRLLKGEHSKDSRDRLESTREESS